MATNIAYLEAVVGADVTAFRRGMQQIRNETGILSESMKGIAGIGRTITLGFTVPMMAMGSAAAGAAMEFDASMRNINAIAGMTEGELSALSEQVLDFGASTREGANAASEALYTVYSAGVTNVTDAFGIMEVATRTAEAGLADMTNTTEGLTAVLLAYGDTSKEAAWATSDAITAMVGVGVGSMSEFNNALSNVVPTAAGLGISFNDVAANLAFMTQRGLSAAKASTSLNSALTSLVKPTKQMEAVFADLGVNGAEDLITQFGSLDGALAAVIGQTDGTSASLSELFSNVRGMRAVNLFAKDVEGWSAALAEFDGMLDGATMQAWESQMASFSAQADLLTSAVESAGIAIGSQLLPMLSPGVSMFTDLALSVKDMNPEIIQMGIAFTAATGGIGLLMWSMSALLSPIGIIAGAVAALAVAFHTNFGGIADTVTAAVNDITGGLEPLTNVIDDFFNTIFPEDINGDDILNFDDLGLTGLELDMNDYITIEANTSLWDLFISNGYDDYFSWDSFMVAAQEGGWSGGALNMGDMLTIDMSETDAVFNEFGQEMSSGLGDEFDAMNLQTFSVAPEVEGATLQSRFVEALGEAWNNIQPALQTLVTNVSSWINTNGATAVNALAGLFSSDGQSGGDTPVYAAIQNLLSGDLMAAIDAIIPGAAEHLQGLFGSDFGSAINNVFPDLSAALTNLMNNAADWLITQGVPTLARGAGYVMSTVGSMLVGGITDVVTGLTTGGGIASGANILGESVVSPFAEGFNDGITNAGGDIGANPIESLLTGIAGGIATMAIAKFALFGGAARSVVFAFNLAMAGVNMSLTAAGFIVKMGLSMTAAALTSVAPGLAATAFAGKMSAAFSSGGVLSLLKVIGGGIIGFISSGIQTAAGAIASTGIGTAVIGGVSSAISTAVAGITAATGWIATAATTILGAIGSALTAPVTIGLVVGSLAYFAIPDSVKDTIRGAFNDILDGVFGEGTFDGMLGGFEQSMYALMAHLAYMIGNFDGRFNDIGDTFVSMVDDNIADRFMLTKPPEVQRGFTVTPFMEHTDLDTEIVSQINDVLPHGGTITGGDIQAMLNANLLLDTEFNTEIDPDFYLEQFTTEQYDDLRDLYHDRVQELFAQGVNLDDVFIDWSDETTTIDVENFMPEINFRESTLTMLSTEQVTGMVDSARAELQNAMNTISTGLSGAMGIEAAPEGEGAGLSPVGNLMDVTALQTEAATYNTALATELTGFGATVVEHIGAGTDLDAQRIVEEFLTPLENAWVTAFGAEGAMQSAITSFGSGTVSNMAAISAGQLALLTTTLVTMPFINNAFVQGLSSMLAQAKAAGEQIWQLQAAIGALLSTSGSINVQVNVSGSVQGVDGSHSTGISYVPKNDYLANLHVGERVLTASENREYNKGMTGGVSETTNNVSTTTTNNITIEGATDAQGIIDELDRMGIYLK